MTIELCDALTFVQSLAPTWRKPQQVMLAEIMRAMQERPTLCLSEIARALAAGPRAHTPQSLHGRFKRLERFLSNPRLDEGAILARCYHLTCRLGCDPPSMAHGTPILPLLLDTTYFEPFAALIMSVPCGSRGLPIAFTTYHRHTLEACFPPPATWPTYATTICPPAPRKKQRLVPASAVVESWLSQNLIEAQLIEYVWSFLTPGLRAIVVADRAFARASLFRSFLAQQREFVIRFDAETWLSLPDGTTGPTKEVTALRPGQRRWFRSADYGQEDRVPVAVLAIWDVGQKEPWYLATTLSDSDTTETLYRWRMRIECGNRDEKSGVILREGSDQHSLDAVLHMHRLLLAIVCLHWLAALAGLQAYRDLPALPPTATDAIPTNPLERVLPNTQALEILDHGPALPPPVIPHRGFTSKPPTWMRRFAVRGHLSYVRLGMEVLRASDLGSLIRRAIRWLSVYLWRFVPLWRPRQLRYRLKHWWPLPT